jgi:hypothetical protein
MMIINIICAAGLLYKVEEWLTDSTDGMAEESINHPNTTMTILVDASTSFSRPIGTP